LSGDISIGERNMAAYKIPADVYFVDEFPMAATGKVSKRVWREEAIREA
jgi:acyl-CoA synthetase (AMP-forming)/AMP-acid ligase II